MIKEVLSPEFLRQRALELEGKPVRRPLPRPLDGIRTRRNRAAPFIPSNEGQSLLQSALEEGIEEDPAIRVEPASTDDPCGTGRPDDAAPRAANETLGGRFGPDSFGWLQTKWAEITSGSRAVFSTTPVSAELAADARVLLVSDWGTGLRGAQLVGEQMRVKVKEAVDDGREVHVIHLGDVYYCGRPREYARYFLDMWPVRVEDDFDRVYSWNLNGNHDMYSGGGGYFGLIAGSLKGDTRGSLFERQGGCSYFKIGNKDWRIYGLDSAYDEHQHLGNAQLDWLRQELRSGTGRAMLLSHHQLDSVYDRGRVNGVLLKELGPDLKAGRVRAWFWGHEHRCVRYDPFQRVEYPRCIGNGGVPEVVEATFFSIVKKLVGLITGLFKHARGGRPPKIRDDYRASWPADGVHWRRHGFVCLDFHGAEIRALYVDQCGNDAFAAETLT